MAMKVLIIDDEEKLIALLSKKISSLLPDAEVVGTANSVETGIAQINTLKPDIIFLDINLTDGSGFNILEAFDKPDFEVVFITAYNQYAIEAFRFSAVDYLLKPVENELLIEAFNKAANNRKLKHSQQKWKVLKDNFSTDKKATKILIQSAEGIEFIEVSEIIRIEADRRYSIVFMVNGQKILTSKNLKEYEELLSNRSFMRIHNSHIINLDFVVKLKTKDNRVVLKNKELVEISRRRKDEFIQKIQNLYSNI